MIRYLDVTYEYGRPESRFVIEDGNLVFGRRIIAKNIKEEDIVPKILNYSKKVLKKSIDRIEEDDRVLFNYGEEIHETIISSKKLNEEIQFFLEGNDELDRAIKLLDSLDNYIVTDPSFFGDFGKTFEKKLDRIHSLKTPTAKLKKAKELLLDASGELVDEQFDELHDEIDRFLFETNVYKFNTLKLNNGEVLHK